MKHRVGHIVWYRVETWTDGPLTDYAAIITRVGTGDIVDLMVFDPNKEPYARHEVSRDDHGAEGTWRWPIDTPGV